MPQFPFIGAAYAARSANFDAQVCVNLYPEVSGSGSSKSPAALIGTPGLTLFATLPTGGVQGLLRFSAALAVAVAGGVVYLVSSAGAVEQIGTIGSASGPVSMASNGTQVMLVTGPAGYVIDPAAKTITAISTDAFSGADRVDFVDGYFVFNQPGTGKFQITGLYNTAIDGLDFATAEGSPDLLVSLIVDHRELWLFGETSTEVFFDSGNSDFPFERIQGAFMEHGCAAAQSVAKLDNSVFWMGADDKGRGIVFRAQGYVPQRISTHALESAIESYGDISDAIAWTYQQEGHAFYVLTFPSAGRTWCFDAATSLWHERAWHDADGVQQRHRGACHMAFAGRNIVGDWESGRLYALDLDAYTDNGDAIHRVRAASHIAAPDYQLQFFRALQIDMETGVGLQDGQGADPQAMLQWSDDGGHTWSNEHWVSIGKAGQHKARARWRRLGRSRDRVFRVTITDPVKICLIGASVIVGGGAS